MLDFLTKNKEWVFSGIGVAILGGVIALARYFYNRRVGTPSIRQSQRIGTQTTEYQTGRDIIVSPSPNINKKTVLQVRVHRAFFIGDPRERYFIKVVNMPDSHDVELTHIWYAGSRRVDIIELRRPLPKRLRPSESWESFVLVDQVPTDPSVFDNYCVRLSTGEVFTSEQNHDVPPVGYVSGP